MGTESPQLLVREYRRVQELVQAARAGVTAVSALEREGQVLLQERDVFMARRIRPRWSRERRGLSSSASCTASTSSSGTTLRFDTSDTASPSARIVVAARGGR